VGTARSAERVRVHVPLARGAYDVVIGPGARHELASLVPPSARRAAVVTQEGIGVEVDPGVPFEVLEIPDGEAAKTLSTVEDCCRRFARQGLSRADVVVAVGGGVVTDVAGFAASCYHRGVALVNVATTLLGQVDAAIGGKTAVNLPEGKNLVGAFWQPVGVLCDTETLETLPEREWASGRGEMAKYAFLGVEGLERLPLVEQVARCVAAKAAVVAADEREARGRMVLNYGHTLAHALEAAGFADADGRGRATLRHGEAVAIGLVFAARLAERLGRIDSSRTARHEEVVRAYGLPCALPADADVGRLLELMRRDKKARGSLTFVLDGPRGVEPVEGVEASVVAEVLAAMPREAR
jgi:5-deoxy-5-amino-3-dehydroquinate synthase